MAAFVALDYLGAFSGRSFAAGLLLAGVLLLVCCCWFAVGLVACLLLLAWCCLACYLFGAGLLLRVPLVASVPLSYYLDYLGAISGRSFAAAGLLLAGVLLQE